MIPSRDDWLYRDDAPRGQSLGRGSRLLCREHPFLLEPIERIFNHCAQVDGVEFELIFGFGRGDIGVFADQRRALWRNIGFLARKDGDGAIDAA